MHLNIFEKCVQMNEHLRSLIVFQLELDQEQDKVGDFYFCAAISLDAAQSIEPHPEADFTNLRLAHLFNFYSIKKR